MAVEGAENLDRKLAELGAVAARKVMRGSMRAAMNVAKAEAHASAPEGEKMHRTYRRRLVSPGFAKRSLRVIVTRDATQAKLGVRKEAFYALQFVELGTARIPASPWLRPAFARAHPRVLAKLIEDLRRRISKVKR